MKNIKIFVCALFALLAVQTGYAQNSKPQNVNDVTELKNTVWDLETGMKVKDAEIQELRDSLASVAAVNKAQQEQMNQMQCQIDTVNVILTNAINDVSETLGIEIDNTRKDVSENKDSIDEDFRQLLVYGIIVFAFALMVIAIVFYLMRRRIGKGNLDIASVRKANEKLAEQSVSLDLRLTELLEQQLRTDENLRTISANAANSDEDHSLVLSVANEMMRIEQNLAFMDPKTKGVSQLKNRAAAISSALAAKGYEVPNLVNTEYKEGMNYEVVMEPDESLDLNVKRIKRVTQPCVIYKGKMIQTAKVVVAYNPDSED